MNKIIHREHIEIAGDGKNVVNVVFVQDVVNQLIRLATTQARTYERLMSLEITLKLLIWFTKYLSMFLMTHIKVM